MGTNLSPRPIAVIAIADDGTTYRIERRCRTLPGDSTAGGFFYCCLPDGSSVSWLGRGRYQLADGTVVRTLHMGIT